MYDICQYISNLNDRLFYGMGWGFVSPNDKKIPGNGNPNYQMAW